jgi:hypothetical protein
MVLCAKLTFSTSVQINIKLQGTNQVRTTPIEDLPSR